MKEYDEVVFEDQLKHYRVVAKQIDKTREYCQKNWSWFPEAQRKYYSQYGLLYAQSREKYGDKIYGHYAKRNRLRSEFRSESKSVIGQENRDTEVSMAHLVGYKYPQTTNGEYGSVRPSELFFCY
ncbi:uncharacterized protein LOC108118421 [Drosophila eugracilis]|uniref:uncharacterized protein LOC108118421 n=1 Tax=Drosophila eugracilis TaxID=29029 RepID=UPI001BDA8F6E|nr:uncharacterized protein LOC108118421 [Drosophila eugracilis]